MVLHPVILSSQNAGVVLVRWDRLLATGVADAAGALQLELAAPPLDRWYLIDRLVVQSDSALASIADVFVGSPSSLMALADTTLAGNGDISEYPRGLYVPGGVSVVVVWSGATPGARCAVSAQVALMAVAG